MTPPGLVLCPSGLHWVGPSAILPRTNPDGTPARSSCVHCAKTCAERASKCRLATIRAIAVRMKSNTKGERVFLSNSELPQSSGERG